MKTKKRRESPPGRPATSASDGGGGAAIVATSQVSRFHNETVETLSNDVDLKQVNVVVGDRHLLVDADLKLMSGVKYSLVGQNGVGKSTLLRCIGRKTLVGLPANLRVLHVEQLEDADPARSVVGTVLASDDEVARHRENARALSAALETHSAADLARTVRRLRLQAREDELCRASDVAAHRSGARGHAARQRLIEAEAAVEAAKEEEEREPTEEEANRSHADAQAMLAEALAVLDIHDDGAAEGKARSILAGLGFSKEWQDGPLSRLSGGWKIRVALACALFLSPDILLLDEPTNHLDLPAVLWLQKYVSELEYVTVVTVSHDRAFVDAVSEQTIVFRDQKLFYYEGSYDAYVKNAEDKRLYQVRMAEAIDRKKTAAKKSVEAGMVQARKAGDDKKMAAMASKQRKLDQIGLEVNEKGHRFKLTRDMPGFHFKKRQDVVVQAPDKCPPWVIPEPAPLRHQGPLLGVENISVGYVKGKPILEKVTINIDQEARIGIVGANGEGKSTLVKVLIGQLPPESGMIQSHPAATVGYFSQDHIEALRSRPVGTTPVTLMLAKKPDAREHDVRAHLSGYGLKSPAATTPLAALSGGQLVRVAFALATFATSTPHLLVLDEPTNHLDFLTAEALLESLKGFRGAVVVVSHDQYFLSNVARDVYLVQAGTVRRLENGVAEYVEELTKMTKKKKRGSAR